MMLRLRRAVGPTLVAGALFVPRQAPAVQEEESLMDIVADGKAVGTIVLPDDAFKCVEYAARELVYHISESTGATLTVARESSAAARSGGADGTGSFIYLGNCRRTGEVGIDAELIPANGFRILRSGSSLFLAGRDNEGAPIDIEEGITIGSIKQMGTLFAVYEFLETQMGVKWLWPGKLGEMIPRHRTIRVGEWDQTWRPPLLHVRVRSHGDHTQNRGREGWSSPEARAEFLTEEYRWLRRHRFAREVGLDYPHAFTDYWERYGPSHPEYFNLLPNGRREPDPHYWHGAAHMVSICVSQPAFWQQVVANWQESRTDDNPWINLCENDAPGKCTCASCRAWDVPAPGDTVSMARAREEFGEGTPQRHGDTWSKYLGSLSDRYARFYLAVQRQAEQIHPGATVVGFSYANYARPPVRAKLNERVIINLVPHHMFPWTDEGRREFRDQWQGWSATGARLYLRPNYTLDGHNFPIYYARQLAEDFAFAFKRGMIASDFHALTGQYSTQGPTLYVLARIQTQGDRPVDEILDEYYQAFGPAAAQVRAYFDHWEAVSDAAPADSLDALAQTIGEEAWGGWTGFYKTAELLFTPAAMQRGYDLLQVAASAAVGDVRAEQRVAYLEKGLKNAELTMAVQKEFRVYETTGDSAAYIEALEALDGFRATAEGDHIANMSFLAWAENRTWDRRTVDGK